MHRWVRPTAEAVKPLALQLWRQGAMRCLLTLGRRGMLMQRHRYADPTLRRFPIGNAVAFGVTKSLFGGWDDLLYNPKILAAVDQAVFTFCEDTLATATSELDQALDDLRALMRAGLPKYEASTTLAEKVVKIFASPYRALRIATTESSRLIHAGQFLAAKDSGVVRGKSWLSTSQSCKKCFALNMLEVPLDKPFITLLTGGPYAVVMYPPLHPNCSCSWAEVL
jgi:hypothetical protein